jgi:hypothetical protein
MSGLYENMPFDRGASYDCQNDETAAVHLEGREFIHQDQTYGTGMNVKVRIVRNRSGATLTGRRAVSYNTVAGKVDVEVSGYATVAGARAHVVDDMLTGSVADKNLFYVVVEGPCLAKTDLAGGVNNLVVQGDYLHTITAATTGATTAGRLGPASFAGTTAAFVAQIANVVGRAISAKTTANTNADILIFAGNGRF